MYTEKDLEDYAKFKLEHHGLAYRGWIFVWSKGKRQFGYCDFSKKTIAVSRIIFNALKEDAREWKAQDTVLHEIAHAIAGRQAGHGIKWQNTAVNIGAEASRCADGTLIDQSKINSKYTGTCPNCGNVKPFYRYSKNLYLKACGLCCTTYNRGKWDERFLFNIKQNY
jgi:hypothetical protein